MDFKEIQELIRMVNKNNIAELTIENQDFRIKIKTALAATYSVQAPMMMPQMQQQPMMQQIQQSATSEKTESTAEVQKAEAVAVESNTIVIKSPIVGTIYRSPGPDKEVFVKVGDEIGVGTKLCIIEAMKLFNEIESEYAGRIVKILVEDRSPVEFDQPLFLIEPK